MELLTFIIGMLVMLSAYIWSIIKIDDPITIRENILFGVVCMLWTGLFIYSVHISKPMIHELAKETLLC